MLTSFYFFGKKENGTLGKDVIFDSMDDPTDVVVAIEELATINKDNAVLALDGFIDEENEDWGLFFLIRVSILLDKREMRNVYTSVKILNLAQVSRRLQKQDTISLFKIERWT